MTTAFRAKKKYVIQGFHDKVNNTSSIIEETLPILIDENYSPFILTKDIHFTITTRDVLNLIKNYRTINELRNLKEKIAGILVLPGLVASVAYIFNYNNPLANLFFWVALLAGQILWHDYYRKHHHPGLLPQFEEISEKSYQDMKDLGLNFTSYKVARVVNYLDFPTQKILSDNSDKKGLDSFSFFKKILKQPEVKSMFQRAGLELTEKEFEKYQISAESMPFYPYSAVRSIIVYALEESVVSSGQYIEPEHFMLAMLRVFPVLQNVLEKNNSSIEVFREIVRYETAKKRAAKSYNKFDPSNAYYRSGGLARSWIYGYTFILNKFSKDISEQMTREDDEFRIGHEREVESLVAVLGRITKKNALLIGEAGVGKSSLVKGLAQRINRGDVPPQIYNKRVIQLDINGLVAQASATQNIETLLKRAMEELSKAGNTILFIDEIQELVPTKAETSGQSIASIMLPFILDSEFPVIGTVNHADYKRHFYENESFRQSFENIEVDELSPLDTLQVIESQIEEVESAFGIYLTYPALMAAVELSQRYITDRKLPDSAVGTLQSAGSWAQANDVDILTAEHIAKSLSVKQDIPIETVTAQEAAKLMSLEVRMQERIIGQQEAIHAVVEALKRARTDIRDPKKPIATYLFLGPTGTGKTHIAKVLSDEFFGARRERKGGDDIIRIDMSEYKDIDSVKRFLGSSPNATTLIDRIKQNPFTVVLFDEIEKAHADILDLFLQVFDEGRLTSERGETVSFTNTIIICTSNIGSGQLLESLERKTMWEEAKNQALMELRQFLRPELLNRFDKVIVFEPHEIDDLAKITELLLNELSKRLKDKGIQITWGDSIPMLIANRAQEPGMGARPIKRFIQDNIETKIADEMLNSGAKTGDVIEIRESWLQG